LSRTDSIGDVVLTLPMAGLIKKNFPQSTVLFLGRTYTRDIVSLSGHIDQFVNFDDIEKAEKNEQIKMLSALNTDVIIHVLPQKQIAKLARKAGIRVRVGTTNRIYHWFTCNKLIRLSRKNSDLHESQLNLKLLSFLNITEEVSLTEMSGYYGFKHIPELPAEFRALLMPGVFNLILHPKSKGSAKEWGLENFKRLIEILPQETYHIFISGTDQDRAQMNDFLESARKRRNVTDITGTLSLRQFIAFINHCDGLVAASTGPLHIAAALGKSAIGIFSARRPIHPGRWQPVGKKVLALVYDESCQTCKSKKDCDCVTRIEPERVKKELEHEAIKR
jgi:heptosyltransferase-3